MCKNKGFGLLVSKAKSQKLSVAAELIVSSFRLETVEYSTHDLPMQPYVWMSVHLQLSLYSTYFTITHFCGHQMLATQCEMLGLMWNEIFCDWIVLL